MLLLEQQPGHVLGLAEPAAPTPTALGEQRRRQHDQHERDEHLSLHTFLESSGDRAAAFAAASLEE